MKAKAAAAAGVLAALVAAAGCGNTYRPVVTAINPVGPASQPQRFALAISDPGGGLPGIVTIVDFSGDTVLITANVGVAPYFFWLNATGTTGYTLNGDATMTSFDVSTSLQTRDMVETTLLNGAAPNSIFADTASTYLTEAGRGAVAQLTGAPPALKQELPITTGYTPVYIAGYAGAARQYVINQNASGGNGLASSIDTTSSTISGTVPLGNTPVYGVMTSDGKRVFIMNKADGTVSVINAQANALDAVPSPAVNPIPVGTAPIWADLATTKNELVVLNSGDGVNKGSASIINIPLCSTAALPGNANCDATNPIDATGFGQVLATVPVGVNPQMVAVLQDGSRAYVVNKADSTVSVVNLTSNTVTATIPVPNTIHPNFIAAINGTPTGKIYVTSPESTNMTIIRTDTDIVETTIPLQGYGVQVRAQLP
ncbi:MAG: YncE family protein [Edaphobacter sp.]|uniref:YncE family protein n=1 Tax=Edaphobacter sp. TaxID=1934404 RepID=UPI002393CF35|nr:YncE family protein [Edaphobacter sp.]MDE1175432.1 YncE family protein [Edaphobacter sp.]